MEKSKLVVDGQNRVVRLEMDIDTEICSVMDYFEIFLVRMLMCRRAAEYLNIAFELTANGVKLI